MPIADCRLINSPLTTGWWSARIRFQTKNGISAELWPVTRRLVTRRCFIYCVGSGGSMSLERWRLRRSMCGKAVPFHRSGHHLLCGLRPPEWAQPSGQLGTHRGKSETYRTSGGRAADTLNTHTRQSAYHKEHKDDAIRSERRLLPANSDLWLMNFPIRNPQSDCGRTAHPICQTRKFLLHSEP
jgi:hypothetical protein